MANSAFRTDHLSMRRLEEWRREDGQTMAEYSVILAVITPAIVAALTLLGFTIAGHFEALASLIS
jgi:Flp pilus assembly pilin Flp